MFGIGLCKRLIPSLAAILVAGSIIGSMGAIDVNAGTNDGFIFETQGNNTIVLTEYTGSAADVEIPNTVNGKKVVGIDAEAFKDNKTVKTVKIPSNVTTIGENAFKDAINLTSVQFSDSVTTISKNAFKGCTSLSSVKLPNALTTIKESTFEGCTALSSVSIPNSVKTIETKAFYGCQSLMEVSLSENVTAIGQMALGYGYNASKGMSMPYSGFTINCSEGTKAYEYAQNEGFLLNTADIWETIANETGVTITGHKGFKKALVIPEKIDGKKVTAIGVQAFYGDDLIESVKIPEGVTVIDRWAFDECPNLKTVIIPSTVKTIGTKAFMSDKIKTVCCTEAVYKLYTWNSTTTRHVYDNDKDAKCNICNYDRFAPTPTPTIDPSKFVTTTPVPTKAPEMSVGDFVDRCYQIALGREADEAGFNSWVDKLNSGAQCGSQVGYGFIFSQEYTNKKTSDEQFVKDLYSMFFGREADEAGFKYWVGKLTNKESRESVFQGFANSTEFANLCAKYGIVSGYYVVGCANDVQGGVNSFVARMYRICLDRLPDQAGQSGWVEKLMNGSTTGASCARGFVMSTEFANKKLSNADFVAYMYRAFFGREADQAGLEGWVTMLERGSSREVVFNGFVNSTEFSNLCSTYGIKVK
ncbi:MAG: DUF4214 domain-containing protein [Clostridia bacterium]|nr:DUF4214 domain-containing protein [Clostridia bacterium]